VFLCAFDNKCHGVTGIAVDDIIDWSHGVKWVRELDQLILTADDQIVPEFNMNNRSAVNFNIGPGMIPLQPGLCFKRKACTCVLMQRAHQ